MTDVMTQYIELVLSGLAGAAHMVSCTVLALTHILYQFKGDSKDISVNELLHFYLC